MVTAAHCVTAEIEFDPRHPADTALIDISTLDGNIATKAMIVFMDTMADLAILGIESLTGGGEILGA